MGAGSLWGEREHQSGSAGCASCAVLFLFQLSLLKNVAFSYSEENLILSSQARSLLCLKTL